LPFLRGYVDVAFFVCGKLAFSLALFSGCSFFHCQIFPLPIFPVAQFSCCPIFRFLFSVAVFTVAAFTFYHLNRFNHCSHDNRLFDFLGLIGVIRESGLTIIELELELLQIKWISSIPGLKK